MTKTAKRVLAGFVLGIALLVGVPAVMAKAGPAFLMCPSGRSGVATTVTSCAFADNVAQAYFAQGGGVVYAYSPVTGGVYRMTCLSGYNANFIGGLSRVAVKCFGGNDAEVVVLVMKVIIEGVSCDVPYAYARYTSAKVKAVHDLVRDLKRRTKNNPTLEIHVIRVTRDRLGHNVCYGWSAGPVKS